jgi:tetratricopeptide (TPR) repeat protein
MRWATIPIPRTVLVLLLALAAVGGWAQATVSYAYGKAELAQGAGWRELAVGDRLPTTAVVRLGAGSVAELSSGELRMTLSRPGTYRLSDLLRSSQEASRWSLGAVVRNKVRLLFSAPEARESAPMAVRAESKEDAGFTLVTEASLAFDRGKAALGDERYEEAARHFEEAVQTADPPTPAEYLFFAGYALAMAGKNGAAQRALEAIQNPESLSRYAQYVLLWARLAIEGQGYAEAEKVLVRFLQTRPTDPAAQEAQLLAAFCSQQLGRQEEAAARLRQLIDWNPSTEAASAARQALERL